MKARSLSAICRVAPAAVMIVWLALTSGAAVAQEVVFRATATTSRVGNDGRYGILSVSGWATHLGPFEGMRITWKQGSTIIGTTTMERSGDDSIEFYTEVEFDKQDVQGSGFYVITGGTGRFHDATGSGFFDVGPSQNGTRTLTWDGWIDY